MVIVFLVLSWIFVSLRVYVKAFLTKSWAADDLLLGVAQVDRPKLPCQTNTDTMLQIFFTVFSAGSLVTIKNGTGKHLIDIPLSNIPVALHFWWLGEITYTITLVFIRLSVAVFLLRICVRPVHKLIIYGIMMLVIVFSICYMFLLIFQCHPVSYFWLQVSSSSSFSNPAIQNISQVLATSRKSYDPMDIVSTP